jgi:hypothetical protein
LLKKSIVKKGINVYDTILILLGALLNIFSLLDYIYDAINVGTLVYKLGQKSKLFNIKQS